MLKISLGRLRFFLSFLGKVQVVSLKDIFGEDEAMVWCGGSWRLAISIMAALIVARKDESTKWTSSQAGEGFVFFVGGGVWAGRVWLSLFNGCCGRR